MVENIDISAVVTKLSGEFDGLIDEREKLKSESAEIQARLEEIDRKLTGIQQTLHGLSLYVNAQEAPTQLTKKTRLTIDEALQGMKRAFIGNVAELTFPGPDVNKTLTECIRDILRQRKDWMTPVQVREALQAANFDFSGYTSNPLSSIHTTLKRLGGEEVETEERGDGQVYRWKNLPHGFVPMNTPADSVRKK